VADRRDITSSVADRRDITSSVTDRRDITSSVTERRVNGTQQFVINSILFTGDFI